MANARTLQQKYKPHFELPENLVPGLYKAQYTNWTYGSERLQDLHMRSWKPRNWHVPDWKTDDTQNVSRNIYDCIFLRFLYAENLGAQNMPKLYE